MRKALHGTLRVGAFAGVLLVMGCAGLDVAAPPHEAPPQAAQTTTVPDQPKAAAPLPPAQAKTAERAVTVDKTTQPRVVPSAPPAQAAAKAAAAPPAKSDTPTAAPKAQAAPPLDLKSLETRLKETQAIGVFTKLTLKNQIDELLERFRAFYQGKAKTSLAELRRSYDMLVLKVLALLQNADPPLASAVANSREAIWRILSDPAKFAAV